ncbi:hypothetical protein NL676_029496 [Syzygium grande]|nr:hypothetical protein NL676_029496 [Syzygium grande]
MTNRWHEQRAVARAPFRSHLLCRSFRSRRHPRRRRHLLFPRAAASSALRRLCRSTRNRSRSSEIILGDEIAEEEMNRNLPELGKLT